MKEERSADFVWFSRTRGAKSEPLPSTFPFSSFFSLSPVCLTSTDDHDDPTTVISTRSDASNRASAQYLWNIDCGCPCQPPNPTRNIGRDGAQHATAPGYFSCEDEDGQGSQRNLQQGEASIRILWNRTRRRCASILSPPSDLVSQLTRYRLSELTRYDQRSRQADSASGGPARELEEEGTSDAGRSDVTGDTASAEASSVPRFGSSYRSSQRR